jgi:methionine biosynthesis protein MetW
MKIEERFYEKFWEKEYQGVIIEKESRIDVALKMLENGEKLLDVGCGNGNLGYFAKNNYSKIYGIDLSDIALKTARKRGLIAKKINVNDEKIPFSNNFFDAVVCLDVIEHVFEPRTLVEEISRVIKKDGILIISIPNIRYWKHILKLVFQGKFPKTADDSEHWDGGHLHYFTSYDIEKLLKKYSFKIQRKKGVYGRNFFKEFSSTGIVMKFKCLK